MGNQSLKSIKEQLDPIDHNLLSDCPGKDQIILAKVCDVHDGDTITILTTVNGYPIKTHIRIVGIDTPEIRTKNLKEKQAATVVYDYVNHFIGPRLASSVPITSIPPTLPQSVKPQKIPEVKPQKIPEVKPQKVPEEKPHGFGSFLTVAGQLLSDFLGTRELNQTEQRKLPPDLKLVCSYVWIEILGNDKYGGRFDGKVYPIPDQSLSFSMNNPGAKGKDLATSILELGLAKSYGGEKKTLWTDAELDKIITTGKKLEKEQGIKSSWTPPTRDKELDEAEISSREFKF